METVYYFSDVLCIWAYIAQARIDEMAAQFDGRITIDNRFCSVFPDARGKIETVWKDRGKYEGFNAHLMEVASQFPHVTVNKKIWIDVRPRTSTSAHTFLKAVHLIEQEDAKTVSNKPFAETLLAKTMWDVRCAFFEHGQDISNWTVLEEIAEKHGIDRRHLIEKMASSEAVALLDADYKLSANHSIEGSPTILMNNGRQKLYGNVGYKLIEANLEEMLRRPSKDRASWC